MEPANFYKTIEENMKGKKRGVPMENCPTCETVRDVMEMIDNRNYCCQNPGQVEHLDCQVCPDDLELSEYHEAGHVLYHKACTRGLKN